jgi:predicted O-methyltransferase YrrM
MMRFPRFQVIIDKLLLRSPLSMLLGLLAAIGLLCVIASVICWLIGQNVGLAIAIGSLGGLVVIVQILIYRRLYHEQRDSYRQVEALFSLHNLLNIRYPLPPMREWVISPDLATVLIGLIRERKPRCVVEAGSGVSTLISAYCLQENGEGKVFSLEHQENFANVSSHNVARHGLSGIATILPAPLKRVDIRGTEWLWYDTAALAKIEGKINLLFVDGPLDRTQKLARYPALPLLFPYLSDDAVIVMDDGIREDEQRIVRLWLQEFEGFELETVPTEKITFVLRRKSGPK